MSSECEQFKSRASHLDSVKSEMSEIAMTLEKDESDRTDLRRRLSESKAELKRRMSVAENAKENLELLEHSAHNQMDEIASSRREHLLSRLKHNHRRQIEKLMDLCKRAEEKIEDLKVKMRVSPSEKDQIYLEKLTHALNANRKALETREKRMWAEIRRTEESERRMKLIGLPQTERERLEMMWAREDASREMDSSQIRERTENMIREYRSELEDAQKLQPKLENEIDEMETELSIANRAHQKSKRSLSDILMNESASIRDESVEDEISLAVASARRDWERNFG